MKKGGGASPFGQAGRRVAAISNPGTADAPAGRRVAAISNPGTADAPALASNHGTAFRTGNPVAISNPGTADAPALASNPGTAFRTASNPGTAFRTGNPRKKALAVMLVLTAACGGTPAPSPAPLPPPPPAKLEAAPPARVLVAPKEASPITFERMARHPEPGWNVPRNIQLSPDGKTITFLASEAGNETMSLFAFDVETGKADVLLRAKDLGDPNAPRSREEELRRERQRDRNEGITSYQWAKRASTILIPQGGDLFVRDASAKIRRLTKTPEPELDPKLCDSGERVAFVRKGDLFTIDVASGRETALTTGATEGFTRGLSDFNAQEEMGEPSGFFWSPKCDRIVYVEVDEREVEKLPVLGWRRSTPDLMLQRYPRPGGKNPVVRAGIADLATKKTTWLKWPDKAERYLGRFTWAEDGKTLYVQALSRDQKRVGLNKVDPQTGVATEIAVEESRAWVTFNTVRPLKNGSLISTSAKSGHKHLVLLDPNGAVQRELTSGAWDVENLAGVDEVRRRVLFTGTRETPLERHVYSVPLAGGELAKLTEERGVHSARFDESMTTWVDIHSAADRLPRAVVRRASNVGTPHSASFTNVGDLPIKHDADLASLRARPVRFVQLKSPAGDVLHGAILEPREIKGRHPAVVFVYGGPGAQTVYDSYSARLFWQHLADRGFVVFQLDNRGAAGRGPAFQHVVHKQLGTKELEDQLAGAAWLAMQPSVDASRIGIYGHSYGGFMAALAMLDGKGVFKAGVAGSPVTDWRLYDSGYTERYMETPQTNAIGYETSDLAAKAEKLQGHLFLLHASMDENVHFAHTAKLVDALVAKGKTFDLLVLPGERHGTRNPAAKAYVFERIADFFAQNL